MCGPGWLSCGTAALSFDPICGDGTGHAVREGILAAAVIFAVGWFVATVVKRVLTGVLAAIGVDRLSERLGISRALGSQTLSGLLGTIVYLIILIPVMAICAATIVTLRSPEAMKAFS